MNITLSRPLVEAFGGYCADLYGGKPFSRKTLNLVHRNLPGFEHRAVHVSSFEEYLRLISLVYSKDKITIPVSFNNSELCQLQDLVDGCNSGRSDLYSMYLCSLLFPSGKFPVAVKDFIPYFMSGWQDYGYQLVFTGEICALYSEICPLPMTALVRAACFYYQNIAPGELRITDSASVAVTNASTGWRKFFIRGSAAFKNRLFELKRATGKTINCVVNNAAFQFLSNMRELAREK